MYTVVNNTSLSSTVECIWMQKNSKMESIAPYTLVYMPFLAQVVETKLLSFMSIYY